MHCRPLPGGMGFVCGSRAQRRRCSTPECSNLAGRSCDFRVVRKSVVGTCDKALCDSCATRVGPDLDYCRAHVSRARNVAKQVQPGTPLCSKCGTAGDSSPRGCAAAAAGESKQPCGACGVDTIGRKRGP